MRAGRTRRNRWRWAARRLAGLYARCQLLEQYKDRSRTLAVVREIYNHLLSLERTGVPGIGVGYGLGLEHGVALAVEFESTICLHRVRLEEMVQVFVRRIQRISEEEVVQFDIYVSELVIMDIGQRGYEPTRMNDPHCMELHQRLDEHHDDVSHHVWRQCFVRG